MNLIDREKSEKKIAFQNMQDELYNKNDIKEHLDFIKDECIDGWSSEAEKEKIDEAIETIKNASKEIKGYNDFVKYLAVFSKVDVKDNEIRPMLNLFKTFYKTFKGKEIDLDADEKNLNYYKGIDSKAVVEFYEKTSKKLGEKSEKELPKDFYDNEEIEQIVFVFLTGKKSEDEKEEYKKMILSKIMQHYSHPAIFYNKDVLARVVLFNYYYLVYKFLNSEAYKKKVAKIEEENKKYYKKEKENERKQEQKGKKQKEKEKELNSKYHIVKTILILLFLAFLLLFGTAGKILALLILLYYGIKGMLKGGDYISKDALEGIKEEIEAQILAGEDEEDEDVE